jgi:glycosyltransferase involved in cell wall biosynthesis
MMSDKLRTFAGAAPAGEPALRGAGSPQEGAVQRPLNVLILNSHLPIFPGTGGHEYLNTTGLTRHAGRVGLVSMVHTHEGLVKSQRFAEQGVNLYLWQARRFLDHSGGAAPPQGLWPRLHRRLVSLVQWLKALPARPLDTVTADLNFRNTAPYLAAALSEETWDALVVIQSSAAAAIDYLPRPLVSAVVLHDIRSQVFRRQAAVATSWWRRLCLRAQAWRYYRFEKKYLRRYDLVITLSETDAAWVRKHYGPQRLAIVPIPVDASYFAPLPGYRERAHRIVFTGLMSHAPNCDAAAYFAREVFPAVRAQLPDAEFYVVGKHPSPEVRALGSLPGVTVTGGVPDTRPYLAEAAVVVVPLRFGSGVRNKILEAWGLEKCVVSTSLGAEGLQYQDGIHLAIADDTPAMIATVLRALNEPELRDRLRFAGRTVARSWHDPEQIAARYYGALHAVAAEKQVLKPPMRLAIDLRWMLPGRAGGIENLARSFLRHLLLLDRFNSYTVMLPARVRHDFDLRGHPNVRLVCPDSVAAHAEAFRRQLWRWLHGRFRLDNWESNEVLRLRLLRSLDANIAYSFPGYIRPDLLGLRHVLMVPDIQHEYHPEFFNDQALAERRRIYTDAVRRADHICAISEFTRQTLIDKLGVPGDKVTTVLLAADPMYQPEPHPVRDRLRLRKYGLEPGSYVFFPAHTWYHKNHRAAVAALRILRDKHGLTPQLVCSGGAREAQPLIEKLVAEAGLEKQVRFLGYCPQDDVPVFYRHAHCLLYPSLFEGFGMPVLEAMSSGCPVVCSNTSSLPEIAGDAALQASPHDHEALADAVASLSLGGDLRAELLRRGLAQAQRFSWQRHTLETVAVFHRVHRQLLSL